MNKSELTPLINQFAGRSVRIETFGSNDPKKAPPMVIEGKLGSGVKYKLSEMYHLEVERIGTKVLRGDDNKIIRDVNNKPVTGKPVTIKQSIPYSIIKSISSLRGKK